MQHPRHSPQLDRPPHSLRRTEDEARRDLLYRHSAEKRRDCVNLLLDNIAREYASATSDEERIKLMLIIADEFQHLITPRNTGERLVAYMDTRSGDDAQQSTYDKLEDMIKDLQWFIKELAEERAEAGDE